MEEAGAIREYKCSVSSPIFSGEARVSACGDALLINGMFSFASIPYRDIHSFDIENYSVLLETCAGQVKLSGMGSGADDFLYNLHTAYNHVVAKALFAAPAIYEAKGEYCYSEDGETLRGEAVITLTGDGILILPRSDRGRRIPLCFIRDLKRENYKIIITLDSGDVYELIKLGREEEQFMFNLSGIMKAMQDKAVQTVRKLCPSLGSAQITAIARLLPEGAAAPIGALRAVSAEFVLALEAEIAKSRAAEPYKYFKQVCKADNICIGIKGAEAFDNMEENTEEAPDGETGEEIDNIIFIAAPNISAGKAAVEIAVPKESAAATFCYAFEDGWESFFMRLNHAMEAIDFKREIIWMSDADIEKSENTGLAMAIRRSAALKYLRGCFIGRVIHTASWQREVAAKLGYK